MATILEQYYLLGGLELAATLSEAFGAEDEVTLIDKRDSFVFGYAKLDVLFREASATRRARWFGS